MNSGLKEIPARTRHAREVGEGEPERLGAQLGLRARVQRGGAFVRDPDSAGERPPRLRSKPLDLRSERPDAREELRQGRAVTGASCEYTACLTCDQGGKQYLRAALGP